MGIAAIDGGPKGGALETTSIFPDFVVGKSYELKFEPGLWFSSIPDINYPKSFDINGVRYVFYHEHRNYVDKTITVSMRLESLGSPVQATIATPIVIGVVALVIGVVTVAMLREVKEVVSVLPPTLQASVMPLVLVLALLLVGNYIYTHRAK